MRLNDQRVRSLAFAESGQREYADGAIPGLAVVVGTRTKTFRLVTGTGAARKRHTIGQYDPPAFTLAMAREKARDILAAQRLDKSETPRFTFTEAFETYDRVHISKLRKGTQRAIQQTIPRHFQSLCRKHLTDIRPTDIAPLLDTMLDTRRKCTTHSYTSGCFLTGA